MTSTARNGGAILLVHWGSEVRTYIYSGFIEKLARYMPVTVVSRIVDSDFVNHLPDGVGVVQLPDFTVPPLFARIQALGNNAHSVWRESQGEFVSTEYYSFKPKPKSYLARVKAAIAPILANRTSLNVIDSIQRHIGKKASRGVPAIQRLLQELDPSVILAADYLSVSSIIFCLAGKDIGVKTVGLPKNWNNIHKCARIFWDAERQLVFSEDMRRFILERNPRLRPDSVVAVGSPQFDFHFDASLILPRAEFAKILGLDTERPIICYSAAAPRTVAHEARILRALLEDIRYGRVISDPQVVVRLNPIGSDPEFLDLAEEFPNCHLCDPKWEYNKSVAWICSSYDDVKTWANLIFHSVLNISVPSTVTLDFAAMDKPVINVAFDPPDIEAPAISLEKLWQQDLYRPIAECGAIELATSQGRLTSLVNETLNEPRKLSKRRKELIQGQLGGQMGNSSERIIEEVLSIT
ncbi:hypothetical protein J7M28_05615 [bacterium]|nr:hypothetical protein [bacterium]